MTRRSGGPTAGSESGTAPVRAPAPGARGAGLPQIGPTARQDQADHRLAPDGGGSTQLPPGTYGRGVRTASSLALMVGAVLVWAAFGTGAPDGWRSAMFGAGLVGASSAASVLVSAHMFRVAPAATAPALAALYLLKVLALGWLLVVPTAPSWLVPGAFLGWALVVHLVATACFVALTRRVSRHEAGLRARAAGASPDPAQARPDPADAGLGPAHGRPAPAGDVGADRHRRGTDPTSSASRPRSAPGRSGSTR